MPEADADNVREILFRKNYRIIYALRGERVLILAIIHAGRDLKAAPNKPWDVL